MAFLSTSEAYRADDISIEDILVELADEDVGIVAHLDMPGADALVTVQTLIGRADHTVEAALGPGGSHLTFTEDRRSDAGATFSLSTFEGGSLLVRLRARGFARARIVITQVRRAVATAFRALPCKVCKLAVKTVVSAILVQLGIPVAPSGDFDLRAHVTEMTNAAGDIAQGLYGSVVDSVSALLPASWWSAVLTLLHAANWLLDASDSFFERSCAAIGMCPPVASAPRP